MLVPLICKADEVLMVGATSVPVKLGSFSGAFESRAVSVAVDAGFDKVLLVATLPRPSIAFVITVWRLSSHPKMT